MKTLRLKTGFWFIFLCAVISLSCGGGSLYAAMDDKTDEISQEQSSVFSPGYINVTKQRTDAIINQINKNGKKSAETSMDKIDDKLNYDLAGEAMPREGPELKKKTGSGSDVGETKSAETQKVEVNALTDDMFKRITLDGGNKAGEVKLSDGNIIKTWSEGANSYFSVTSEIGATLIERQKFDFGSNEQYNRTLLKNFGIVMTQYKDAYQSWDEYRELQQMLGGYYVTVVDPYDTNQTGFWSGKSWWSPYATSYYSNLKVQNVFDVGGGKFGVVIGDGNTYAGFQSLQIYGGGEGFAPWSLAASKDFRNINGKISSVSDLGKGLFAYTYEGKTNQIMVTDFTNRDYGASDISINIGRDAFSSFKSTAGWAWDKYSNWSTVGISSLGEGNFAIAANAGYYGADGYTTGSFIKIVDSTGLTPVTKVEKYFGANTRSYDDFGEYGTTRTVDKIKATSDGNLAILWKSNSVYSNDGLTSGVYSETTSYDLSRYLADTKLTQLSTSSMGKLVSEYSWMADQNEEFYNDTYEYGNIADMRVLSDGSIVVAINKTRSVDSGVYSWDNFTDSSFSFSSYSDADIKILRPDGQVVNVDIGRSLGSDSNRTLNRITVLGDGTIGAILNEAKGSVSKQLVERFDASGSILGSTAPRFMLNPSTSALAPSLLSAKQTDVLAAPALNAMDLRMIDDKSSAAASLDAGKLAGFMKKNGMEMSEGLAAGLLEAANVALRDKDFRNKIGVEPLRDADGNIDAMAMLMSILKNPTEDQKMVLDLAEALLVDISKIQQESDSHGLSKAQDDLLQMVAQVLMAQAMPDLLKEGDVSNIKSIFVELNDSKSRIMEEHRESMRLYYDEVVKGLAKNIEALQLNNIMTKGITKEELEKMPRNEIDKILDKIRKIEKKSFEEEYVLQQEAKFRKRYVEPANKMLEEKMKELMKGFTKRISMVLEGVSNAKK